MFDRPAEEVHERVKEVMKEKAEKAVEFKSKDKED
jgi:hypothetical protein